MDGSYGRRKTPLQLGPNDREKLMVSVTELLPVIDFTCRTPLCPSFESDASTCDPNVNCDRGENDTP